MKAQPTRDGWCLALGKLQATFDMLTTLHGARNVDRWQTLDGHIGVDWSSGPYAYEVVGEILEQITNPDIPSFIELAELSFEGALEGQLATFWIGNVRVRMRPLSPVGADVARSLAIAQARTGPACAEPGSP